MQRSLRMNDIQLLALAEKGLNHDHGLRGYLYKRTSDNSKWQLRWFLLYQNLLFYYENESSPKPSGVILLEGSYCDKVVQPNREHHSSFRDNSTPSASSHQVRNPLLSLLFHLFFPLFFHFFVVLSSPSFVPYFSSD